MIENLDNPLWIEFEGHRIPYVREGAGRPMVFYPNAVATHRLWDYQIEHFRQTHDVVALDTVGLAKGRSDQEYPIDLYVRLLARVIHVLELGPLVLAGNCVGSLASLHYAARHPENVSALVVMNMHTREANAAGAMGPPTEVALRFRKIPAIPEWYMRHMPGPRIDRFPYVSKQFGDQVDGEYHGYTRKLFADPAVRVTLAKLAWSLDTYILPDLHLLRGVPPVCWIWGEKNRIFPLEEGKRLAAVVKPTEEHIVKGAGHATARERPDEVNRIIERFLARYAAGHEKEDQAVPAAASG